MFELLKELQPTRRELALHSKAGEQIANEVAPTPSAKHLADYARDRRNEWTPRKGGCGEYNCFGLMLASRRTAIYEQEVVERALEDDGFRHLPDDENPTAGDFVLYWWKKELVHCAEIVEVGPLIAGGEKHHPARLVSKWSDSWGEDFHALPHTAEDYDRHEIWTDRP